MCDPGGCGSRKEIVPLHSITRQIGVEVRYNSQNDVVEVISFHKNLSTHPRVDTRCGDAVIVAVVDVARAKAEGGGARVDIVPVVVMVGDL